MFEDRSKTGYNYKKLDNIARTKVDLLDDNKHNSNAHKKLFGKQEMPSKGQVKQSFKEEILQKDVSIIKHNINAQTIENLPSSSYLQTFENKTIGELEEIKTQEEINVKNNENIEVESEISKENEINIDQLIEITNNIEIDNKKIQKELKTEAPKPKKNYSFRIKLVTGVYCIIVALFGGWVISNIVNINQTNSAINSIAVETEQVNSNILEIISKIKELDTASGNPDNENVVVQIITEEMNITPEAIIQPNTYEKSSNWFDVFCNWISGLFGG